MRDMLQFHAMASLYRIIYLLLDWYLQNKFDVFNALDLMENKEFLEELKFGQGDGNLQYYMYNWRCASMPPEKVTV